MEEITMEIFLKKYVDKLKFHITKECIDIINVNIDNKLISDKYHSGIKLSVFLLIEIIIMIVWSLYLISCTN